MGRDKPNRFRGGKKSARDKLFGIDDSDFWRWNHRQYKGRTGDSGLDIDDIAEVKMRYDEWVRSGSPKAD